MFWKTSDRKKSSRRRNFKVRYIAFAVVIIVCYLICGAMAPFINRPGINTQTSHDFSVQKFFSESEGIDRAMLLETNISAWEERLRLLNCAQKQLIISTFDMRPEESTMDIMSVVLKKADEGVDVKILVDGISGLLRMEGEDLFYALASHENIEIRIYNPVNILAPWTLMGRMHDKYVIVDDMAYILGGRNTFDYFIGDYATEGKSYDREVLIYNTDYKTVQTAKDKNVQVINQTAGQAIKQGADTGASSLFRLTEYFDGVWNLPYCKSFHDDADLRQRESVQHMIAALNERYEKLRTENPELFVPFDYVAASHPTNKVTLISNPADRYAKEPVVFYQLTELMKTAEERVVIHTPYAVCDQYMYKTLKAVDKSVPDMMMMINSVENGDNFVASSDYLRHKDELFATGIDLYEYDGGVSYHGKSMIIDDFSVIGSYNMDLRSTYVDTELMVVIESASFTDELLDHMDDMHVMCRKVTGPDTYDIPAGVTAAEVPASRRILWKIVGFLLQPFRIMI